jgi:hypothetical protein
MLRFNISEASLITGEQSGRLLDMGFAEAALIMVSRFPRSLEDHQFRNPV